MRPVAPALPDRVSEVTLRKLAFARLKELEKEASALRAYLAIIGDPSRASQ